MKIRENRSGIWRDVEPKDLELSGDEQIVVISERGKKGVQGDQGIQGEKGDRGPQGPQGEKGDKGDQGEKGDKGDKGEPGIDGKPGIDGAPGEKGEKGDKGEPGEQGPPGMMGLTGLQGLPGIRGKDGTNGIDGKSASETRLEDLKDVFITDPLEEGHVLSFDGYEWVNKEISITGGGGEQGPQGARGLKGDTGDVGSIFDYAEKVAPANNDIILIEDSAALYVKKKVKISNLPGGTGGVESIGVLDMGMSTGGYVTTPTIDIANSFGYEIDGGDPTSTYLVI